MNISRGLKIYGISVVVFGVYNLLGISSYHQFSLMFKGLSSLLILIIYLFTVIYAVCCIYCGLKILKKEDWARKTVLILTSISVASGFFLNKIVITNFKDFIETGKSGLPENIKGAVYTYIIVLTAVITLYELSVIYFFTRPGVVFQFKK